MYSHTLHRAYACMYAVSLMVYTIVNPRRPFDAVWKFNFVPYSTGFGPYCLDFMITVTRLKLSSISRLTDDIIIGMHRSVEKLKK